MVALAHGANSVCEDGVIAMHIIGYVFETIVIMFALLGVVTAISLWLDHRAARDDDIDDEAQVARSMNGKG